MKRRTHPTSCNDPGPVGGETMIQVRDKTAHPLLIDVLNLFFISTQRHRLLIQLRRTFSPWQRAYRSFINIGFAQLSAGKERLPPPPYRPGLLTIMIRTCGLVHNLGLFDYMKTSHNGRHRYDMHGENSSTRLRRGSCKLSFRHPSIQPRRSRPMSCSYKGLWMRCYCVMWWIWGRKKLLCSPPIS